MGAPPPLGAAANTTMYSGLMSLELERTAPRDAMPAVAWPWRLRRTTGEVLEDERFAFGSDDDWVGSSGRGARG